MIEMITIKNGHTHGYHVYKDGERIGFIAGDKLSYDEESKECDIYYKSRPIMILHNVIEIIEK